MEGTPETPLDRISRKLFELNMAVTSAAVIIKEIDTEITKWLTQIQRESLQNSQVNSRD